MNFLSHFYFERFATNPERMVGALLPDLVKNADKKAVLRPQKREFELFDQANTSELYKGWQSHLMVDRLFHNSDFFYHHTHEIKKSIEPIVVNTPIRPSFLAHIALELLLDHILIVQGAVSIDKLYTSLEKVNRNSLQRFLSISEMEDIQSFNLFFDKFIEWRYLYEYTDANQISKALYAICRRIWQFEVNEQQKQQLSEALVEYLNSSLTNYKDIFQYISYELPDY